MRPIPISAIITAYQRIDQTLETLRIISSCDPCPDEILVHVDANQQLCADVLRKAIPNLKIIISRDCVGPGGGRNKLIAAAKNDFVASFDDDSYPIDNDYFARVLTLLEKYPAASIVCAAVYHQGERIAKDIDRAEWVSDFVGCGCIYRRDVFLATEGYVPLPIAYGMEEVDLAIRLHAQGEKILKSYWLRIFHNTDLGHHSNPKITAGSIANQLLLTYLRYPLSLWLIGIAQCISRVLWLIRNGRWQGILSGLLYIPGHLIKHRHFRNVLPKKAVNSYLALRHNPELISES